MAALFPTVTFFGPANCGNGRNLALPTYRNQKNSKMKMVENHLINPTGHVISGRALHGHGQRRATSHAPCAVLPCVKLGQRPYLYRYYSLVPRLHVVFILITRAFEFEGPREGQLPVQGDVSGAQRADRGSE